MSTIRRTSILSSGVIYIGFAFGALNNLLFARWLTTDQNGLVQAFVAIGNIIYPIATVGMPSYINKFYPYYKGHLPVKKNEMLTLALFSTLAASVLVVIAGIFLQPFMIRQFGSKSALLVQYYGWVFPYGLGLSLLYVAEAYGWQVKRSVLTNFLRELFWRVLNTILILLFFFGILKSYDPFIKLYSFNYLVIALFLLVFLWRRGDFHFVFSISRVTKRFWSKIKSMIMLTWGAGMVLNLSTFFAQPVLAAVDPRGLTTVAVFSTGQFIASLIMAPQRGIAAAAVGPLSHAWREKDLARIERIYKRSVINQLIFAVGMYVLIAINFRDGILFFGLPKAYLGAEIVFLLIGLNRVIDMGTGVNTQIIGTSIHWRFDFYTGVVLVAMTIPLNYVLAKRYGIMGPAIADLGTFAIYNSIRCIFLYRKYGFQPFGRGSLYALLAGGALFTVCHWLFDAHSGLLWMIIRSAVFLTLYGGIVLALKLSDDVQPVWGSVKKRLGWRSDATG